MTRRSKGALERKMAANKKAHRFGSIFRGAGSLGEPGRLRFSRIAGLLPPDARAEFERERAIASHCPEHGELVDPAILLCGEGADQRVAFVCPWCSGPEILSQWEKEGAS